MRSRSLRRVRDVHEQIHAVGTASVLEDVSSKANLRRSGLPIVGACAVIA